MIAPVYRTTRRHIADDCSPEMYIQGEHKFFPLLQTFITRKLRGIQTYFFNIT